MKSILLFVVLLLGLQSVAEVSEKGHTSMIREAFGIVPGSFISFDLGEETISSGEKFEKSGSFVVLPINSDFEIGLVAMLSFEGGSVEVSSKRSGNLFTLSAPILSSEDYTLNIEVVLKSQKRLTEIQSKIIHLEGQIAEIDQAIENGASGDLPELKEKLEALKAELEGRAEDQQVVVQSLSTSVPVFDDVVSEASLTLSGIQLNAFNPLGKDLIVQIANQTFTDDIYTHSITHNSTYVDDDKFVVTSNAIVIDSSVWVEGRNTVGISTQDISGGGIHRKYEFWVGTQSVVITVLDGESSPIEGARVEIAVSQDLEVNAIGVTDSAGKITFHNLPSQTFLVKASDGNNSKQVIITSQDSPSIVLESIGEPSNIDNNDFSQGTDGWDVGDSLVEIIPHVEDNEPTLPPLPEVDQDKLIKNRRGNALKMKGAKTRQRVAEIEPNSESDLRLTTSGVGSSGASRTFMNDEVPGDVVVRYKFTTEEVPAGFFGTEFNDSYCVTIRTASGEESADCRSMNSLGRSAFNGSGVTDWMELAVPVVAGDLINVAISVTNAEDELYDSSLTVDFINKSIKPLRIVSARLNDIDGSQLRFLSVGPHSQFGGNTRVRGSVMITGDPTDTLTSLELEILQGGSVVARASLDPVSRAALLKGFPENGVISGSLRFSLSSFGGISKTLGVSLRLSASSSLQPGSAQYAVGSAGVLSWADVIARYPPSNVNEGGDKWIQPNLEAGWESLSGIRVGDISNMNGGYIYPHEGHQEGQDMDAKFLGSNACVKNTDAYMDMILSFVKGMPNLEKIEYIGFTIDKDLYLRKIVGSNLKFSGRPAHRLIKNWKKHRCHFHVQHFD